MSKSNKKPGHQGEEEWEEEEDTRVVEKVAARSIPRPMGYAHIPSQLVVPPGALGIHAHADTREPEPMDLDITELVKRKKLAKKQAKELKLGALGAVGAVGAVAKPKKNPGSPSSSSSSVSLSPNEILAFEKEQRLKAKLPPLGSPKSVSPRLPPLGMGMGARARGKPSTSSSSSSSSSSSAKGRKSPTPKFEKVKARSVSPKRKGKEGKEGKQRKGGATRRKQIRKLHRMNSRKR